MNRSSFNRRLTYALESANNNDLNRILEEGINQNKRVNYVLANKLVTKLETMRRRSSKQAIQLQANIVKFAKPYFSYADNVWRNGRGDIPTLSQDDYWLWNRWTPEKQRVKQTMNRLRRETTTRVLNENRYLIPELNRLITAYMP